MEEVFKKIENQENYSVSNLGRVRNDKTGKFLKGGLQDGYIRVNLNKIKYLIHKIVAIAFIENPDNKTYVDHINCIRDDNSIENLRWVTTTENQQNSKLRKDNTSGTKGVCYRKDTKKWMAFIHIDGKKVSIGCFKTKEEAIKIREEKLKENKEK